ncbi:MAG: CHC2 zinc finger domain-containing protein [Syntrophomonadaceae bacterium]|jgi:hypothetical protein|nr:CHC2 zinc finger domain-containing protein [Clostridia bacterium]MDD4562000.1 CHC2 zinc finger domain-containing protein [Syntrophomonadaceae bacterium]
MTKSLPNYNTNTSLIEAINRELSDIFSLFNSLFPGYKTTQKGHKAWSLCPFHQEKTPSFSIDEDKNRAYCFSCHWSGDRIDLWLAANGLTLRNGGLKKLADSLGITTELTHEERATLKRQQQAREQEAKREESLKTLVYSEYDRLISIEKWIYSILRSIKAYGENAALALERPAVVWALKNRDKIEYWLNEFNIGNDADKLEIITVTRGLEAPWVNF